MKKFFTTLSNIWKIEDLRVRITNTLLFLLIYRIGSFVVLPGVNYATLNDQKAKEGLVGLLNMFAGGSFSRASIFALGVMPYISASIVMQLLGIAVPYFAKMQKEGESGRNKINQWTRYLTIAITAPQAVAYLHSQIPVDSLLMPYTTFVIVNTFILTASTLFVMWLGEKITDKGIGNGISLIIMVGIIASLPSAFMVEFQSRTGGQGGLITFIVELVALIGVVMFTILIVQGTRKIAVQYAKRIVGNKQYGGVRQYIPLKVTAAGVMPIIFAQALMFIPATVAQFFPTAASNGILISLSNYNSWLHNVLFALLIIIFTYFYTAITVNPNQMADDMKKNNGFIPGVKPGKTTADYIDGVISKITLPGSIFLAIVAVIPALVSLAGVSSLFSRFFGGTSLIILVQVVLDTLQQIESHLLMRHYDGLMKTGRIKGRTAIPTAAGTTPTAILISMSKINYKSVEEIELIRESSLLVAKTLGEIAKVIGPGVKTIELDKLAETFIRDNGGIPAFLNYSGFPYSLCISLNDQVVHGFPGEYVLKEGDLVSVDCGAILNKYYGDSAYTFAIGEVDETTKKLMRVTQECLVLGVEKAVVGMRIGDIGYAVQEHAEKNGFGVVKELVGHGVGLKLHEKPEVPNYGKRGSGIKLEEGMVIAIEPMINAGRAGVKFWDDGWTVSTVDGKPSAHYEHTVAVGKGKVDILSTFEYVDNVLKEKNNN